MRHKSLIWVTKEHGPFEAPAGQALSLGDFQLAANTFPQHTDNLKYTSIIHI